MVGWEWEEGDGRPGREFARKLMRVDGYGFSLVAGCCRGRVVAMIDNVCSNGRMSMTWYTKIMVHSYIHNLDWIAWHLI